MPAQFCYGLYPHLCTQVILILNLVFIFQDAMFFEKAGNEETDRPGMF